MLSSRETIGNGYENIKCCKPIKWLGFTISLCYDCNQTFGHDYADTTTDCGDVYVDSIALGRAYVQQPRPGFNVDSTVTNNVRSLIQQGVNILNEGSNEGGVLDSKDKNDARNLIYRGLSMLSKQVSSKQSTDLMLTKSANVLMNNILSANKEILSLESMKTDGGILQDRGTTKDGKDTNTANDEGILIDRSKTQ